MPSAAGAMLNVAATAATRVATRMGRAYKIPNCPEPLPSVTSVLNVMDKGGLVPWAIRLTLDTLKSETSAKATGDVIPKDALAGAIEKASTAVDRHKKAAADFGTRAHEAINQIIMTGDMSIPLKDEDKDITAVVEGFKRWYRQSGITLHPAGDTVVYSRQYGYAGAADAIGYRKEDGALLVVDFKTSNSVHSSYALQLAAYTHAVQEMLRNNELNLSLTSPSARNTINSEASAADKQHVATPSPPPSRTYKRSSTTGRTAVTMSLDSEGGDGGSGVVLTTGGMMSGLGDGLGLGLGASMGMGMGIGVGLDVGAAGGAWLGPAAASSSSLSSPPPSSPAPTSLDSLLSLDGGSNPIALPAGQSHDDEIPADAALSMNAGGSALPASASEPAAPSLPTKATKAAKAKTTPSASTTASSSAATSKGKSSSSNSSAPASTPTPTSKGTGGKRSSKGKSTLVRSKDEAHAVVCDELLILTNKEFEDALALNGGPPASTTGGGGGTCSAGNPLKAAIGSAGKVRLFHSLAAAWSSSTGSASSNAEANKAITDAAAAAVAAAWSNSSSTGTTINNTAPSKVEALVIRIERATGDVYVSRVGDLQASFAAFKACLLLFHTLSAGHSSGFHSGTPPLLEQVSKTVNTAGPEPVAAEEAAITS